MSERRISVRLSPSLAKRLEALGRKTKRTPSDLVREAIAEYCRNYPRKPTAFDAFKTAGLIGDAKGLPADLSTNPKYMEGFGRD
jgi:predicted transcriptional regulator